jgi:hypothetical protein
MLALLAGCAGMTDTQQRAATGTVGGAAVGAAMPALEPLLAPVRAWLADWWWTT